MARLDLDQALISLVSRHADMKLPLQAGITPEFLEDTEAQEIWAFMIGFYKNYTTCATAKDIKANWPTYQLLKFEGENLQYVIDELQRRRQFMLLQVGLIEVVNEDLQEGRDPVTAKNKVAALMTQLNQEIVVTRDVDIIKTWEQRLADYETLEELDGKLRGIPTGFPTLDEVLSGLQKEQLITFIGVPKVGKSTLMLRMAISVHEYGEEPLFIGYEMSNEEQYSRHDSMRANIDYHRLMTGRLTEAEKAKLRRKLVSMKDMQPFILSTDVHRQSTVSGIAAKIDQHEPSVVFIDGVYMMEDEHGEKKGSSQALTNITRDLKRLAQVYRLPIVISTQVLEWKYSAKQGLKGADIGYCVDEKTEILTTDGWKKHDDLQVGDTAYTLNHKTGLGEWQRVDAVNRFKRRNREMIRMEGKNHSSLTTLAHRWPVLRRTRNGPVREWATSESLKFGQSLVLSAPSASLPKQAKHSDAFVELMAWFWTEGHINGEYGNVGITQSVSHNPMNVQRIREALFEVFGPEVGDRSIRAGSMTDGVPKWRDNRRDKEQGELAEFWLDVNAGRALLEHAPGKIVSREFLLSLTEQQLRLFVMVSMLADNDGPSSLSQKSKDAAESFQFACTLLGISTSLKQHNFVTVTRKGSYRMWRVRMRTSASTAPREAAKLGATFTVEKVNHRGMVWCPTTKNSSWLARRDGTVYFTGNSSSFVQDSDVVIGAEHTDMDDVKKLSVVLARNAPKKSVLIRWDWSDGTFEEAGSGDDTDDDDESAVAKAAGYTT